MTQRTIQRAAVAAVLVAVLALAAPAQAASIPRGILGTGWVEWVRQWVDGIWGGDVSKKPAGAGQPAPRTEKAMGLSPDDSTATTPPPSSNADKGAGIDPDG